MAASPGSRTVIVAAAASGRLVLDPLASPRH
jgi:hypothetical protein